jgi:hypothetical protein
MKPTSKRLLFAFFLLLAFAVVVIADSQSAAQLTSNALSKEAEGTAVKTKSADVLNEDSLTVAKKSQAPKKKKAPKKADEPEPVEASTYDVEGKCKQFGALVNRAEQERASSRKVSESTKQEITALKSEIAAYYREKAEEAKIASRPDLVSLYEASGRKIEVIGAVAIKDEITKADIDAVNAATGPENTQFNAILKKTDKSKVTAEQKTYLKQRSEVYFQDSLQYFMSLLNVVLSLVNQAHGAVTNPVGAGIGCATATVARVATGGGVLPPEIEMLRTLSGLLQANVSAYKETVANLKAITD